VRACGFKSRILSFVRNKLISVTKVLIPCLIAYYSDYVYTIPPISLTRGRTQFRSVVLYLGSREGIFVFFFPMALVRPSQNGERAGPLAKMLLGAKHGGRPGIMSRIIVEEYFAF